MIVIETDARGGHAKAVRRAPIEIRIERNQHILRLVVVIASGKRRLNASSAHAAVHASSDKQSASVVNKADFHSLGWRRSFVWLLLNELCHRLRGPPGSFVETSVEANGGV